ncbi:MAG TPA: alpha/beta hydrolase [Candidatus Binatia bacterium]|jgi:pimeloyl-ACP methyl ester carboxylesterase|nr:alpha/beta hydrolase [Candidatus Binatia bacterium]
MQTDADVYRTAPIELVDAGDATLACRRFGAGPTLLLVHGFPLHGFTWRHVLPTLAQRFTCIVVDLPGFGDATWSAATDFGFHAHARRLRTVLDRLGVASCHVLAQDTGATIARCLALQAPERVTSLALVNTEMPGHRPPWIREFQWALRLPAAGRFFQALLRSDRYIRSGMGFGGCFADPRLLGGDFHDAFVAPLVASSRRIDGLSRYLLGLGWDVVDAMAQRHAELRMPVLLVWGEDDPTFPLPLARAMADQFPAGEGIAVIPHTRLLPHEERPDDVCAHVVPFLERTMARAAS